MEKKPQQSEIKYCSSDSPDFGFKVSKYFLISWFQPLCFGQTQRGWTDGVWTCGSHCEARRRCDGARKLNIAKQLVYRKLAQHLNATRLLQLSTTTTGRPIWLIGAFVFSPGLRYKANLEGPFGQEAHLHLMTWPEEELLNDGK